MCESTQYWHPLLGHKQSEESNPAHAELLIRYISKDKHISKTGLSS